MSPKSNPEPLEDGDSTCFTLSSLAHRLARSKPRLRKRDRLANPNLLKDHEPQLQEPGPAPECFQDGPKPQKQELEEIDLADDASAPKLMFICKDLPSERKSSLIALLKEYRDVFAWTYDEMPGLDPSVTVHHLNVLPSARPVKQGIRFYKPEIELQIKDEVVKLLDANFIKTIQHPQWLSSIVPVVKKSGQIRVCVD